jgi:hypothetical protein
LENTETYKREKREGINLFAMPPKAMKQRDPAGLWQRLVAFAASGNACG